MALLFVIATMMVDATVVTEDERSFYKWIIGSMAGFLVTAGTGAVAWIKSLIDRNDKLQEARIGDLKENYKQVKKD
jgi:hypothetical protein